MNIGTAFEYLLQQLFNVKRHKGSGNLWYLPLDNSNDGLVVSAKATKKQSFPLSKKVIEEAFNVVKGPGVGSGESIPIVVVDFVEGDEPKATDKIVAIIDIHDLVKISQEKRELFKESKSEAKHRTGSIPILFRKDK